jgi:antitoxin component YwqK of YwqJK toxin-antitoxin module
MICGIGSWLKIIATLRWVRGASFTVILLLALAACESELYQDETGVFHGTGSKIYAYDSGATMRVDQYASGKLAKSTWYKPDGEVIAETIWGDEEKGFDYRLNEKGMVISKAQVLGNLYHGNCWHYDEHGTVTKVVKYVEGVREE